MAPVTSKILMKQVSHIVKETIIRELLAKTIEMKGDINTCHLLFL